MFHNIMTIVYRSSYEPRNLGAIDIAVEFDLMVEWSADEVLQVADELLPDRQWANVADSFACVVDSRIEYEDEKTAEIQLVLNAYHGRDLDPHTWVISEDDFDGEDIHELFQITKPATSATPLRIIVLYLHKIMSTKMLCADYGEHVSFTSIH